MCMSKKLEMLKTFTGVKQKNYFNSLGGLLATQLGHNPQSILEELPANKLCESWGLFNLCNLIQRGGKKIVPTKMYPKAPVLRPRELFNHWS